MTFCFHLVSFLGVAIRVLPAETRLTVYSGAKFLMLHAAIQSDIAPVEKQFRPGFGRPILKKT